ncbi:MAG: alpha/beta fold hydrolase [Myxococcota bacterium]
MIQTRFQFWGGALSVALVACGANDERPAPTGIGGGEAGVGGGDLGFSLDVAWLPCSLFTGGSDNRAECADIEVPLDWSNPQGEVITLFLKRHRGETAGGQSWFLTGGPGQTGADLEPLVEQLVALAPSRTYYLLDHRGVGRSTRLRCPSAEGVASANSVGLGEGEIAACLADLRAQWSDEQLSHFSTVNAAHDVGQLIDYTRAGDEPISLWAGSYGTLWLERYLGFYPEQPESVVFAAVALDVDMLSVDRYVGDMALRWLAACEANERCGDRFLDAFGQPARQVAQVHLSGAGASLCPELSSLGLSPAVLKPFFGQLLEQIETRSLFAPLVYRLARCAPEDVLAWQALIQAVTPPAGPPEIPYGIRNWGFVLGENISVSELIEPRTAADVRADYDAAIAVQGPTPRLLESSELWPRYDAPPFGLSAYRGATLMLHGEFDFLPESVFRRAVDHYVDGPAQADFVRLPHATHSLESPTDGGGQCGLSLAVSRLLDAAAEVAPCAEQILSPTFAPPPTVSSAFLGTDDPWDGVPVAAVTAGTSYDPTRSRGPVAVPRWPLTLEVKSGSVFSDAD